MATIHEKIVHLLEARRLKRRDLAKALGVSPQTATDICKGRSAITLPHLRSLVQMFQLRADYWLDEERLQPSVLDQVDTTRRKRVEALAELGVLAHYDPALLFRRLRSFAAQNGEAFRRAFPDLSPEDFMRLGMPDEGRGQVGRIGG